MVPRPLFTALCASLTITLLVAAKGAWALPYSVLVESNTDRSTNEIYLANYGSYADLLSNTLDASSAYSALNVSSNFSVGGYTMVGTGYSALLESNDDRSSNEIYVANYASYADLLSNTLAPTSAYSLLNVSSAFSVGGFTFDGTGYSVLLESDADRSTNEIYIAHYASYADLLSNTLDPKSGYSALNVSSNFSVGGISFDGGGYSVLLESDADRSTNEIYLANYASYEDLINNTLAPTSGYSLLNISSAFSVGGLAIDWQQGSGGGDTIDDDPGEGGRPGGGPGDGGGLGGGPDDRPGDGGGPGGTPVPEPATLSLLALAGLLLALRARPTVSRRRLH